MDRDPILIVEDNPATRKVFRLALQTEGYAVMEAADGSTALRVAAERPFSLVLLDCRLPDLTGVEVVRRLRAVVPDLPVVAVTGWAQADEASMLSAGFMDILVKPVEPSRLLETVRRRIGAPGRVAPSGKRVLVIDDDPAQRKLAQLALMNAGLDVDAVGDGESGLNRARAQKPDVILSDVLMPGLDGFRLCEAVRSDPALADVPVVLTSSHYIEDEDRALAARFGANQYVSRTLGLDAVIQAVVSAIDQPDHGPITRSEADLRGEYMRRIAHQLERQAAIGADLARRASLQATALSVLDSISDALVRQLDPESALGEMLTQCLDSAGLSVGAILLRDSVGRFIVKAHVGASAAEEWERHADVFEHPMPLGSLAIPSAEVNPAGDRLLAALGVASVLIVPIVARDQTLGVLVLASNRADFVTAEGSSFVRAARSVSMQLGQALALSRTFSRLAQAEQRYRALLDNAQDTIAVLSPEGTILELNRRWEELLDQPRLNVIGRHFSDFGIVEPLELAETVAQAGGASPPVSVRRGDGSAVNIEISRTVVAVGDEKLVLSVGRDVTDRLALAEQLRHSQKMEAVGRLAGGVAHDMNNVLGAVMTYAEFLTDALDDGDPRRDDAEEIRKAARRGAALTRQLLAFSRQQVVQPRVVDLNEVINGMLKMLRTLVGEDIDVRADLVAPLPSIKIDPGHLEQVLMNLAVNARDAMPTGGTLLIATSSESGRVKLTVSDEGMGMDQATRERVFEPFFTTKAPGKGTGLGLSTVFGIVKQSGGDIDVESESGRGTTFRIAWPRASKERDKPRFSAWPPRVGGVGSGTIVLVEDDDALRAALARKLRAIGYQVFDCAVGAAAISACEAHAGPVHLLVTDVVLPGMTGPEIARRLGDRYPALRVLYMSGYTDTTAYKDVPVGEATFLQKPFTPDALAAKVRAVFESPGADVAP
jgi:PAS domain S-box-containing protein